MFPRIDAKISHSDNAAFHQLWRYLRSDLINQDLNGSCVSCSRLILNTIRAGIRKRSSSLLFDRQCPVSYRLHQCTDSIHTIQFQLVLWTIHTGTPQGTSCLFLCNWIAIAKEVYQPWNGGLDFRFLQIIVGTCLPNGTCGQFLADRGSSVQLSDKQGESLVLSEISGSSFVVNHGIPQSCGGVFLSMQVTIFQHFQHGSNSTSLLESFPVVWIICHRIRNSCCRRCFDPRNSFLCKSYQMLNTTGSI
mmetsp:Transcript_47999/g.150628  ORF Transcript_47999/g.150628 Transcript_47999/m.150628 type:complete len:248 (+) Transcript_47999:2088-2831(+)